jgi:hypothetical protein
MEILKTEILRIMGIFVNSMISLEKVDGSEKIEKLSNDNFKYQMILYNFK